MVRRIRLLCAVLCACALLACAASPAEPLPAALSGFTDADTGANALLNYQSDTLRVAIRRCADADARQVYYVADIRIRDLRSFRAGFANGAFDSGTENAEAFAAREGAVLAINGSFNTGLVVHDGTVYQDPDDQHDGVLALYADGSMEALPLDAFDLDAALEAGLVHAWQFGPVLVHEGKPVTPPDTDAFGIRHARIMLGYVEPGHYIAAAVDGRRADAIGMDVSDMVALMESLGCVEAMNLDGGLSAIMVFQGKTVNDPPRLGADGDRGRNLTDMVLFVP